MTKKFLSLVLTLALVIGLVPTMGVQAETVEPVPYLTEDFENFPDRKVFNAAMTTAPTINDNDGKYRLSLGKYLKGEIFTMDGYDGNPTQVIDIYASSSADISGGGGRINYSKMNDGTSYAYPTSGKYVMEFKIYVPKDENGESRTFAKYVASPAVIEIDGDDVKFGIGTGFADDQYDHKFTGVKGKWYKLTYVFEYDVIDDTEYGVYNNATSLYVDDVLKGYRENIYGYTHPKNGTRSGMNLSVRIQFNSWGSGDATVREKKHIIFDDFNFYVPGTTTAYSNLNGYDDVKPTENITVDFDNMILERSVPSAGILVSDSDGRPVEVDSVTVSADCKQLIINPKYDLAAASEYSVEVSGLLDMYSQTIDAYDFTFTTSAPNPIVMTSSPVFTKVNLFAGGAGSQIDRLETGYINANYTIRNDHATLSKEVVMIAVLKEGNTIKRLQFKDANLAAGESLTFNAGFNVTNVDNQTIECYVWNSIFGMSPLADKYTFDKNGRTPAPAE